MSAVTVRAAAGFDDPLDLSAGRPRLIGGRCEGCGEVMFPLRACCPACAAPGVARILLPESGRLWTWTIQGFEPKSPPYRSSDAEFAPFGVGYVELEGHLRVEARLTVADPARLRIGMPVELTCVEDDGRRIFAFAPVEDGSA